MGKPLDVMDFIKGFIWHAYSHYLIENFPGPSDWRWSMLVYRIKKEIGPRFPEVNFTTWFDWDAPGPQSESVDEAFRVLVFAFEIDCSNRCRTELCNMEQYRKEWKSITNIECADTCYEIARSIDGFFKE